MDLYEVERLKKSNHVVGVYEKRFLELFNSNPAVDETDKGAVNKLIRALPNATLSQLTSIVHGFFELDDDFVRKSGFKLQFIDSRINAIFAKEGKEKSNRAKYVVGYSKSGYAVISYNPNALRDYFPLFKPVVWEEWVKQSVAEKLQTPKEQWLKDGNDVDLWIANWKEWGCLKHPNT